MVGSNIKIGVIEDNKCYFLFIDEIVFSNLDTIIKKEFISICHGYKNSNKYKVSFVAKEFIKRLDGKKKKDIVGMIGEFIYHVFTKYVFMDFTPISVFFNTEEKSVKKGFDTLLSDGEKVWYSEVKSSISKDESKINEIAASRLGDAYRDLKSKVDTDAKNIVYWTTAIDKLCMCLKSEVDDAIITELLNNDLNNNSVKSKIIVCVIFHDSDVEVERKRMVNLMKKWRSESPNLIGVCIRKKTISKVINLIKEISGQDD